MVKYRIKYNYDSGDSFNQYPDNEGFVEIEWKNIENAKTNLNRIEEHYKMYKLLNESSYRKKETNQEILAKYQDEDWFVKNLKPAIAFENGSYNVIDEKDIQKYSEKYKIINIFDEIQAENCIILYTDDNKPFQFWCPWCGYFEHLNFCEIEAVIPKQNELKFYA